MKNAKVGGRIFNVNSILIFLHNMMKNYPDLTAKEILWSYFLPNGRSIEEAQEKGSPITINQIIASVISQPIEDYTINITSKSVEKKPGIYVLNIVQKDVYINKDINCMVIIANSSSHARTLASQRSNRHKNPPSYKSLVPIWKDTTLVTCCLVSRISGGNSQAGRVIFAGTRTI